MEDHSLSMTKAWVQSTVKTNKQTKNGRVNSTYIFRQEPVVTTLTDKAGEWYPAPL